MIAITDETFDADVIKSDKPVIVDFWAEWCAPCKALMPTMEELSAEMDNVVFAKMNIEDSPETPVKLGVRGVPMLILFKDGEVVDARPGAAPKATIAEWINERI